MRFYSRVVQVKIDINIAILKVLRLKAPISQAFKAKVAFETIKLEFEKSKCAKALLVET